MWGQQVWSSCEDATLRIGGPRTGKTLSLACHGIDAPGALLTTSTRLDLAEMVHAVRRHRGAVHVFNPAGLGGLPSTLKWRVLAGCEDFATAQRRAADLIPQAVGDDERWDTQSRRVLALLLHAAAASGRTMRDVVRWAGDPSPETQRQVTTALIDATEPERHDATRHADGNGLAKGNGPAGDADATGANSIGADGADQGSYGTQAGRDRAEAMRAFWRTNDRTRTSITTTMSVPLAWMNDDRARALGDAAPDDPALVDITDLIARGQTLHLIGHEDHTTLSPLIGALVAEIAHAARHLAADQPNGRLDPPLTMLLDEAAIAAVVPLDRWTADMGGRGVEIHISLQSLAQLRQRWGTEAAAAILANVATFIVFGGSPAASDLRDISLLTGEHRMRVVGVDHHKDTDHDGERRGEYRWVPVLSPAQIRALEPGQVLVMRRGLHVLVGYAPKVTDRRGWTSMPLTTPAPWQEAVERDLAAAQRLARFEARVNALEAKVRAFGPALAERFWDWAGSRYGDRIEAFLDRTSPHADEIAARQAHQDTKARAKVRKKKAKARQKATKAAAQATGRTHWSALRGRLRRRHAPSAYAADGRNGSIIDLAAFFAHDTEQHRRNGAPTGPADDDSPGGEPR
jgi:hypothetical protein